MLAVANGGVVEAWIKEEVAGDILVELEGEGVLPLYLGAVIGGETIETGLPRDVVGEFPREVNGELRTYFVQRVLSFLQAVAGCQC